MTNMKYKVFSLENMVAYHLEDKYTDDEFLDMFVEFIESKGIYCGGGIQTYDSEWDGETETDIKLKELSEIDIKLKELGEKSLSPLTSLKEIMTLGKSAFGSLSNFDLWMNEQNFFFNNKRPIDFLETEKDVEYLLSRLNGLKIGDNA